MARFPMKWSVWEKEFLQLEGKCMTFHCEGKFTWSHFFDSKDVLGRSPLEGPQGHFPRHFQAHPDFVMGKKKLNFLWPKMARLRPAFWPQKSSRKSLCGSLFYVLSQEMRHISFFLGAQNGVFWVGTKKFMLKKFMCFFGPVFWRQSLERS